MRNSFFTIPPKHESEINYIRKYEARSTIVLIIKVDEWPGESSMDLIVPPCCSTTSFPTIFSTGQSAPLTKTSGRSV